ncbi:GT2 family glycosyltransferase [Rhodovulum iodosum]|uniref:GT2 family glycosyltransferase n=1 Tax=Rhodovulum iodosum TaxID=68291 RepID=A0ABV3XWE7_9RHOB|nr:glycosyltransferase [Rhodovulum robiginosum]RSK38343.1 glycosyltransferase [Rhodovulum robiginosum]
MRLVFAIASTGRERILADCLAHIALQDRLPDLVILSLGAPEDAPANGYDALPFPVREVIGPKGLTRQRNRVLDALEPGDILLFLDDDFLMAPDYLRQTLRLYEEHPDIVMLTGTVVADGINGPGFSFEDGLKLLADAARPAGDGLTDTYNGYGCNMSLRADPVISLGLRFDERLPFYGWLEDVDFGRLLARHGRIVRAEALVGVHLGTKTGRGTGLLLGYSQIANPLYLIGKGTMRRDRALRMMRRNVTANLAKALWPEPWVDRVGRLRGNLLALGDLVRGRIAPERVLDLR